MLCKKEFFKSKIGLEFLQKGDTPTITTPRRFVQTVTNPSSLTSRGAKMKRKPSKKIKKGPMEGINENAEDLGEVLLEEFAAHPGSAASASGSQPEEPKYRWASKYSPHHMYCAMKAYEDILDDIYATPRTKDRRNDFLDITEFFVLFSFFFLNISHLCLVSVVFLGS